MARTSLRLEADGLQHGADAQRARQPGREYGVDQERSVAFDTDAHEASQQPSIRQMREVFGQYACRALEQCELRVRQAMAAHIKVTHGPPQRSMLVHDRDATRPRPLAPGCKAVARVADDPRRTTHGRVATTEEKR